jgi:subtilisin family serine protease
MDFVCNCHIDGFIYAGDMTLGIRTGSVLRFYKKLGLAPWGYLEDHDFNIPVAVDDIFYVNDLSVGIRKNNTVNFYWKVGQAPWSLRPVKPFLIADSKTRDFSGMQKYLDPAPLGVDARYAWTIPGGKGKGVTIVDIENPLDLDHEDFKPAFWISAGKVNSNGDGWGEHGTSVIGLLIGQHNGFGIDGICPDAEYGVSAVIVPESPGSEDDPTDEAGKIAIAAAIDSAASHLKKGDIILIEQFLSNPTKKDFPAREDCPSAFPGSLPVEYDKRCFDAILRASEKGIIVVEPAANGGVNLDDSLYQGLFSRDHRDSKAIMVGADEGGNRAPACWTNYGSRVDFFSWGNNIVTTGKGDLPFEPFDRHKKYTQSFSGTSGAAPIIAGVIACLQGIQIASGKQLYTADDIRRILIGNAPKTESQKLIGLAPNLKETILRAQSQ